MGMTTGCSVSVGKPFWGGSQFSNPHQYSKRTKNGICLHLHFSSRRQGNNHNSPVNCSGSEYPLFQSFRWKKDCRKNDKVLKTIGNRKEGSGSILDIDLNEVNQRFSFKPSFCELLTGAKTISEVGKQPLQKAPEVWGLFHLGHG